jgi:hypothetical protein
MKGFFFLVTPMEVRESRLVGTSNLLTSKANDRLFILVTHWKSSVLLELAKVKYQSSHRHSIGSKQSDKVHFH